MAVCEITTSDIYDPDGYPIDGGLMDSQLGVVDPGLKCKSCNGRIGLCPGHFGYMDLARPVIHVKYAGLIHKILNSVCHECGWILLSENYIEQYLKLMNTVKKEQDILSKWKISDDIYKHIKASFKTLKKCYNPKCGAKIKEIKFEKPSSYFIDKQLITPIEIRDILERIPNEHLELLGLNPAAVRPEWLVLTVIPVPPVTVRPSITLQTGERAEDDLTHKLVDIVRINQRLKQTIDAGAPGVIIEDLWELLQYHVTTFIDNEIPTLPPARHRAGRPLKGITQRIKSKEGRFRHNLAGKRVNYSARTVISPDSNISIVEVGIPKEIAMELTIPEKVTPLNREALKKLVLNGHTKLEGANYVIRSDGKRKRITDEVKEQLAEELIEDYLVERHLRNGDIVVFNRQPSLHKLSMMAHRAVILPGKTFRINPAVCPPYNADFDGDEMNLHIPQTPEARIEAEFLLSVPFQIMSPRFGGPIIGCHQDHITGAYLLTKKDTYLTIEEAQQLLWDATLWKDKKLLMKKKNARISGKELISCILPENLNLKFKANTCKYFKSRCKECKKEKCEFDSYVVIKDGKLLCGVFDETGIGAFSSKVIHEIIETCGLNEAVKFIDRITRISLEYLRWKGFSLGTSDLEIPPIAHQKINERIKEGEKEALELIEAFKRKELEIKPGFSPEGTLEMEILNVLNRTRDDCVKIVEKYVSESNPAVILAITGARGKILNLAQMTACLGQQAISGSRISRGYKDKTLPHFVRGDIGPTARGFVKSSYGSGLTPFEFFWVATSGREGLTDTSMRTPKSGYMYRRLSNALQDLVVEYDGSVRDNRGIIIQFLYGEDGLDPTKTNWGQINLDGIINKVLGT
jgi:DNA-directed RNA polymerase subunit A'